MLIVFTRLNEGRYASRMVRSDKVGYVLDGVGHLFQMPHDLMHFVVEDTLRLADGFWGSLAAGAVFRRMTHVEGRHRPQARARSASISKANAIYLREAEILVRLFDTAFTNNHTDRQFLCAFADRRMPPEHVVQRVTLQDIGRVRAAWADLGRQWANVPINGELRLEWPDQDARR